MLASFGALVADDLAPLIAVKAADGQTAYWTAGAFWSANPDEAARFRTLADAEATLIVLRASCVIADSAWVTTFPSRGEPATERSGFYSISPPIAGRFQQRGLGNDNVKARAAPL
jgi:hypothetical protein